MCVCAVRETDRTDRQALPDLIILYDPNILLKLSLMGKSSLTVADTTHVVHFGRLAGDHIFEYEC